MKITTMSTESFLDFLDKACDNICNVIQNEEFTNLFSDMEASTNRIVWMFNAAKVICGPCREDIFAILGALSGKTTEDIAKQNLLVTVGMLRDVYQDLKSAEIPE